MLTDTSEFVESEVDAAFPHPFIGAELCVRQQGNKGLHDGRLDETWLYNTTSAGAAYEYKSILACAN